MAKDLNKWLDEFVENGADASDVINWPENAGGGGSEVTINTSGAVYTIDPVELVKLASFIDGEGSIIDYYTADGSGISSVRSIIYLIYMDNTYSLQIESDTIFSVDGDHFTNWSDHITEHAAEIGAKQISTVQGQVLVGVIRKRGDLIQTLDISKLLIKQE